MININNNKQSYFCLLCKHYTYDLFYPSFRPEQGECDLNHNPFLEKFFCKDWVKKNENKNS